MWTATTVARGASFASSTVSAASMRILFEPPIIAPPELTMMTSGSNAETAFLTSSSRTQSPAIYTVGAFRAERTNPDTVPIAMAMSPLPCLPPVRRIVMPSHSIEPSTGRTSVKPAFFASRRLARWMKTGRPFGSASLAASSK